MRGDARPALWEAAQAAATPAAPARALMRVAAWLWYRKRLHDIDLIREALALVVRAETPYAYLQPGGKALESLAGALAVARHEAEARTWKADRSPLAGFR